MFASCSALYTPGNKFTLSEYIKSLDKRDSASDGPVINFLSTLHDGLLVKEGEQTFCGVIPITEKYAFAAASCFNFVDGKLDDNTDYKVYLSGTGYEKPVLMDVTSIEARDDYDPNTFANNLAILTINNSQGNTFANNIGEPASAWATVNYIQQSLVEDLSSWNAPDIYSGTSIDTDACKSASSLYKANSGTLSCNSQTRTSFINSNCKTPLKFAVGSSGGKFAVVGLYSYSAISGSPEEGFCGSDNTIVSYYTNLYDYVPWASETIGATVNVIHVNTEDMSIPTDDIPMKAPSTSAKNDGSYIYSLFEQDTQILGSDNGEDVSSSSSSKSGSSSKGGHSGSSVCKRGNADTLTVTKTETQTETETVTDYNCPGRV
ncbi:hypothetical protein GGI22_000345 [Coemansia erecta]|nr:hypothetical protein GGI22_000345 [Coemansia erecta]